MICLSEDLISICEHFKNSLSGIENRGLESGYFTLVTVTGEMFKLLF